MEKHCTIIEQSSVKLSLAKNLNIDIKHLELVNKKNELEGQIKDLDLISEKINKIKIEVADLNEQLDKMNSDDLNFQTLKYKIHLKSISGAKFLMKLENSDLIKSQLENKILEIKESLESIQFTNTF